MSFIIFSFPRAKIGPELFFRQNFFNIENAPKTARASFAGKTNVWRHIINIAYNYKNAHSEMRRWRVSC
ncbi:MAG: hypothetical protein A3B15_01195 [Candidatus Buchananbacteria bacterium RIFCSPLOWO2_01_FULL_45_31]|uniref:Uncharacterized protein n=1 Tax=Candidatus Buchananbacteria bacterium RIFCSPLOWO2_01_FULL_45_31 TaxID=1797545 RepID=A0A1G1YQR3_9BACT|nr:MAG: hypothetical protein A3B15_01195 [Candidatus Buchananbacteria bacterium RIFCSPLOWO2_01_FULL_45_31]